MTSKALLYPETFYGDERMQTLPIIAIIGRPNVGKSTLFNSFLGERRSIVSDIAGTTRDSLMEKVTDLGNSPYWLVDTAGLTDFGDNNLENEIQRQAEISLENAEVILWVIDGKVELTQDDYDIADKLRRSRKPIIFLANKIDDGSETAVVEYASLGFGVPEIISAKNNFGFWDLTEKIQKVLIENKLNIDPKSESDEDEEEDDEVIKVALVGRPNVGKSSLCNQVLGHERSVVSEVAGTTRDSIDTEFIDEETGQEYLLIDTAGVRKRGKIGKEMEYWSYVRTNQSIERADVCVLLIDALDGVTHQDLVLAGKIAEAGKGVIIGVNKFDLVREKSTGEIEKETDERELDEVKMWDEDISKIRDRYLGYLHQKIPFLPWAPVHFFSAKTGKGVQDIFESIKGIAEERKKRVPTRELNLFLPDVIFGHVAPSRGTKLGKIKYLSQVDTNPPKFIFFVNNTEAFHFSYRRYLENKIRDKYGFMGTPIIVELRDNMQNWRGKMKEEN